MSRMKRLLRTLNGERDDLPPSLRCGYRASVCKEKQRFGHSFFAAMQHNLVFLRLFYFNTVHPHFILPSLCL